MSDLVKPFLNAANSLPDPSQIIALYPTFVAQVLRSKVLGPEKLRVNLSDGQFFVQCIYRGTGADENTFLIGQIIRVTAYNVFLLKDKPCLVIASFDVLSSPVAAIGTPTSLTLTKQPETAATNVKPTNQNNTKANKPADMKGQVFPISDIGPYSNNWVIRARVTNKADVRHFKTARGEGKLFNVTLADESGEIRATAFGEAVDQFFDVLQEGQTYYVSEGTLKLRNQQFNRVNHEYEMSLGKFSKVTRCEEEVKLPELQYKFSPISDLPAKKPGDLADVIGVLKSVEEVQSISSKTTGRAFEKRDIFLVDQTNYEIKATLWAKQAASFSVPIGSVVAFKGAKVSDFNGCTLSTVPGSNMTVNPDIQEAHSLKGWYDAVGVNTNFTSLSSAAMSSDGRAARSAPRITLAEVRESGLGQNPTPDYFTIRGFVGIISKNNLVYPACVNSDKCRKKMQDTGGTWECQTCNIRSETPFYRYSASVQISDQTGAEFMSAFGDAGEVILGVTAAEIGEIVKDTNGNIADDPRVIEMVSNATDKEYIFRCSAKQDMYQDMATTRFALQSAKPVSYEDESQILLNEIEAYGI